MRLVAALALCLLAPAAVAGDSVPVLDRFYGATRTLSGRFVQEVRSADGRTLERASGRFWLARPGKLRWDYQEPYAQQIVADGERLWVYEPELAQATVRPLRADTGDVPGLLLAGAGFPAEVFEVRQATAGESGWVELAARAPDAGVASVRILFADAVPQALELTDALGQVTHIALEDPAHNAAPPPGVFAFEPPPGTDVVGDVQG
jgi:outer membrane lipoprotein carrier protein